MSRERLNLERALRVLGPLEARIMHEVWCGEVGTPFVVGDVQARMPELAYTTVMTTVVRLAEKGILAAERVPGQRAHSYRMAETPEDFLDRSSGERVDELIRLYGDAAIAAFSDRLDRMAQEPHRQLIALSQRERGKPRSR